MYGPFSCPPFKNNPIIGEVYSVSESLSYIFRDEEHAEKRYISRLRKQMGYTKVITLLLKYPAKDLLHVL